MIRFFSDCVRLFNGIFNAAHDVAVLAFLLSYVMILVLTGLFTNISRGIRKM